MRDRHGIDIARKGYTESGSVRLNLSAKLRPVQSNSSEYPLTKLKKSRGENVGYPHTKLHQSPTQDTRPKSAEIATHKLPNCLEGSMKKSYAESPAFPGRHMHVSTYPESHELPSYHGRSLSFPPTCRTCNASFHSNNALHRHLRVYRHRRRPELNGLWR